MKPLIFFNSRSEVSRREITFPNGKKIVISREIPEYRTSDPEEIDFLSKQFAIGCRSLTDKEYVLHMTALFEDMPNVERSNLTREDIDGYLSSTAHEKLVIQRLRAKGYTVVKKIEDAAEGLSKVPEQSEIIHKPKPKRTTKAAAKKK